MKPVNPDIHQIQLVPTGGVFRWRGKAYYVVRQGVEFAPVKQTESGSWVTTGGSIGVGTLTAPRKAKKAKKGKGDVGAAITAQTVDRLKGQVTALAMVPRGGIFRVGRKYFLKDKGGIVPVAPSGAGWETRPGAVPAMAPSDPVEYLATGAQVAPTPKKSQMSLFGVAGRSARAHKPSPSKRRTIGAASDDEGAQCCAQSLDEAAYWVQAGLSRIEAVREKANQAARGTKTAPAPEGGKRRGRPRKSAQVQPAGEDIPF